MAKSICQSVAEYRVGWINPLDSYSSPVQSRRIRIGLDKTFTNSADSGLDWILCNVYPIFRDLMQFLLIVLSDV